MNHSLNEISLFNFYLILRENVLRVKEDDFIPIILVGNKSDLAKHRQISSEEAQALADKWHIPYIETSAKTRSNVDKAFCEVFMKIKDLKQREIEFLAKGGGSGKSKPAKTMTKEEEDAVRADSIKKRIKKFYKDLKNKCLLM
jgi:GTPase SAR1 family protein